MATATPLLDLDSAASKLGISSLKDKQREAITSFVDGHDVFVSLPTGYGKSLCYTLLPLVFDSLRSSDSHKSIVLVVSPLTALMIDQKHKYASLGERHSPEHESTSLDRRTHGYDRMDLHVASPEPLRCSYCHQSVAVTTV